MKEHLKDMKDILQDYVKRRNITVMDRIRYAILDMNKLPDFKNKFSKFTETMRNMLFLLNMEAHDVQIRNNVVIQRKLDKILRSSEQRSPKTSERSSRERESAEKYGGAISCSGKFCTRTESSPIS